MSKRDQVLPRRVVASIGGGSPEEKVHRHPNQSSLRQSSRHSNGSESPLPLQGARVWFLVRELRFHWPFLLEWPKEKKKKNSEALKEDRCSKSTPEGGSCSSSKARWTLEKASGFLRCCSWKGSVRLREEPEVGNPGGKKGSVPSRNGRRPARLQ